MTLDPRPLTDAAEAELRDTLGAELRRLRLAAQLTQRQTAALAGLTPRMIAYLENGQRRPSRETLLRLAATLDHQAPNLTWSLMTADRLEDLAGPHMAAATTPRPARDPKRLEHARQQLAAVRRSIGHAEDRLTAQPDWEELRIEMWRAQRLERYMSAALEHLEAHPMTGAEA